MTTVPHLTTALSGPLRDLERSILKSMPASSVTLSKVKPVYEEVEGWRAPTSRCRTWDELPQKARDYIRRIEKLIGIPIDIVSVGPERDQAIIVHDVLKVKPRT